MNSMTGFGAASAPLLGATVRVEIGGVNRKQVEVAVSLPRAWGELEARVREMVSACVSRGRVNVSVSFQPKSGAGGSLHVQAEKLEELKLQMEKVAAVLGRPLDVSLDALVRLGVLVEESEADIAPGDAWESVEIAMADALRDFLTLRAQEGENMKRDLLARVCTLRSFREKAMLCAHGVAERHREVLMKRLSESGLPLPLDDERLVKEIALYADHCDVSEEMTRLHSHLDQFERLCNKAEPVGRTLDFLCQEIFRELNTTGSKSNDAELAQMVVSAKTELEKIREQVQNIE